MRIAHVLPSLGTGGQERVALDLAAAQRASGCEVTVVSLAGGAEGPLGELFRSAGVFVRTVAKGDRRDVTLTPRLAWVFWCDRINVVHMHNPQPLIFGAIAAKMAGARAVYTRHGENPDLPRRVAMRRVAARFLDAYVAVSAATAARARADREVPGEPLVIENGIDLARFHPDHAARAAVRAELRIPEDAWVVGTVGRLVPLKDHALLVRALLPVLSDRLRVVIAGDGPEAGALAALRDGSPSGRFVHLLGERRDAERVLAALDVFALPSQHEGLPLVILEAMACALPIVASSVGGIPAVLEGGAGLLMSPGDEAGLSDALEGLRADRARAAAMGERGRARARSRYSVERMARDYMAVYRGAGARG